MNGRWKRQWLYLEDGVKAEPELVLGIDCCLETCELRLCHGPRYA